MSEVLSFTEMAAQRVELLPARTVLSVFLVDGDNVCPASSQTNNFAGSTVDNSQGQVYVINVFSGGGTGNPGSAPANAAC